MLIVIDTDTHINTNDIIICYMIGFWEFNSYWGNSKIFLHGDWNEKIWIVWIITIWVNKYFYVNKIFLHWIVFFMWTNLLNSFFFIFFLFFMLNRFFAQMACEIIKKKKKTVCIYLKSWTGWYIDIGLESLVFFFIY